MAAAFCHDLRRGIFLGIVLQRDGFLFRVRVGLRLRPQPLSSIHHVLAPATPTLTLISVKGLSSKEARNSSM